MCTIFLCGHISNLLAICVGMVLLGLMVALIFSFLRKCQTLFQSSYTILHFYQQHMILEQCGVIRDADHPPPPRAVENLHTAVSVLATKTLTHQMQEDQTVWLESELKTLVLLSLHIVIYNHTQTLPPVWLI